MSSGSWITPYGDKIPHIHPDAYVDVSARVIGEVHVEEGASVWPMTVLRADDEEVRIGACAAVLDQSLLEAPEGHPVWLENEALVSHGVIIHGARIQSHALVGIGAIILDGALVSSGSIIGAGSIVTPHTRIPPNSLVLGVPGKIVRETTPEERQSIVRQVRGLYQKSRQLISTP